jgi:hypothetical protein
MDIIKGILIVYGIICLLGLITLIIGIKNAKELSDNVESKD